MSIRHNSAIATLSLLVLGALAGTASRSQEAAAAAGPQLEVESTAIDIGEINRGTSPRVKVSFRNRGSAPLEVTAKAGEAMMIVGQPKPTPPGAEGSFEVELDTIPGDGESTWKLGLASNDPQQPMVGVQIKAKIKTSVVVHPRELRWITTSDEAPATLTATLQGLGAEPFRITKATSSVPAVKVQVAPGAATAEGLPTWTATVTLEPKEHVGPLIGSIAVELDHPLQPRTRIPFSGFVRPAAAAPTTGVVDYGTKTLAEMAAAPLAWRVRYFSEKKSDVSKITVTPPVLDAEAAEHIDPRWQMILLKPNAHTPSEGEVQVRLDVTFSNPSFAPIFGDLKVVVAPEDQLELE